jgi:hypothetical protein
MDNVEPKAPQSSEANLQARIESLRQTLISALILMIVISGTFNIYLYRQWNATRYDVNAMNGMVEEFTKTNLPVVRDFITRLNDYSKTHPDLIPILAKYGQYNATNTPHTPPAIPGAGPAPAAAPKKK